MVVAGGTSIAGLSETSDNISAELLSSTVLEGGGVSLSISTK